MSPLRPRALALAALFVAAGACSSEKSTPAPSTPIARAATPAKPAATPIDPAAFPEAWRADAPQLPRNVQEPLAFIKTMLDAHKATMDQVTCHCCGKSLTKCYTDTAMRAAKACSPL